MNFNQRLAKINTVEDAEEQIRLAKNYARRLRLEAKKADTLQAKLTLQEQVKQAEATLRQLRQAIFDIEDALAEGQSLSGFVN